MGIEKQRAVAHKLVDAVIAAGGHAKWDFDDTYVADAAALKRDADACDFQTLDVLGRGSFCIIYGNAEDGSELIADYTANEFCERIYKEVYGAD